MLTAKDIQHRLISDLSSNSAFMPNYTPTAWFESDVYAVTRAGYSVEYEVKLSRQDFHADKRRSFSSRGTYGSTASYLKLEGGTKHEALARSRRRWGPCRFFFVAPEGILKTGRYPGLGGLH